MSDTDFFVMHAILDAAFPVALHLRLRQCSVGCDNGLQVALALLLLLHLRKLHAELLRLAHGRLHGLVVALLDGLLDLLLDGAADLDLLPLLRLGVGVLARLQLRDAAHLRLHLCRLLVGVDLHKLLVFLVRSLLQEFLQLVRHLHQQAPVLVRGRLVHHSVLQRLQEHLERDVRNPLDHFVFFRVSSEQLCPNLLINVLALVVVAAHEHRQHKLDEQRHKIFRRETHGRALLDHHIANVSANTAETNVVSLKKRLAKGVDHDIGLLAVTELLRRLLHRHKLAVEDEPHQRVVLVHPPLVDHAPLAVQAPPRLIEPLRPQLPRLQGQDKVGYPVGAVELHERLVGVPHAVKETVPELGELLGDVDCLAGVLLHTAQVDAQVCEGLVPRSFVVRRKLLARILCLLEQVRVRLLRGHVGVLRVGSLRVSQRLLKGCLLSELHHRAWWLVCVEKTNEVQIL
eukprot:Rhum_TRINITY_DN12139_c0_g1::Rhum_TRINITY_DN12139_c0_g1_i1::g.49666::m.49666